MISTKGKAMIFFLILFASFVANEKAFGFAEFPPKQQTQLVGSFALAGFVGIYGLIIYLRKSDYVDFARQISPSEPQ